MEVNGLAGIRHEILSSQKKQKARAAAAAAEAALRPLRHSHSSSIPAPPQDVVL